MSTQVEVSSFHLPAKAIQSTNVRHLKYEQNSSYGDFDTHYFAEQDEVAPNGLLRIRASYRNQSNYPDFLPTWEPSEKYDPLVFHEYNDPALRADPEFPHLFSKEGKRTVSVRSITPKLGTEVKGIQLTQLSSSAKDELALLVAQRGVVVLRNQDFAEKGASYVANYGKHFGKLHIHPTSGHPENVPELHITFRRPDRDEFDRVFDDASSSVAWHTDVSYELQPPSYTFFNVLEGPEGGGDTLFGDSIEAFERLSKPFQDFLSTLHVIHSSKEQALNSKKQGGVQRRKPVTHIHPLVRIHPVLKKRVLFVNQSFSRRIVELKKPESDLLLNYLYSLVGNALDLQLRANWEPGTVAIWDNRRVQHSAVIDWEAPIRRHAFRITAQGERPIEDVKYLNDKNYFPSSMSSDV